MNKASEFLSRIAKNGKVETAEERRYMQRLSCVFNVPLRNREVDCPKCTFLRLLEKAKGVKMEQFIGENLNERQIAVLQAVSFNTGGALFGKEENLLKVIETHRCKAAMGISREELDTILDQLEREWLVERKKIKEIPYVGLTDDGKSCNLIS